VRIVEVRPDARFDVPMNAVPVSAVVLMYFSFCCLRSVENLVVVPVMLEVLASGPRPGEAGCEASDPLLGPRSGLL
jgi:hypothetical protein